MIIHFFLKFKNMRKKEKTIFNFGFTAKCSKMALERGGCLLPRDCQERGVVFVTFGTLLRKRDVQIIYCRDASKVYDYFLDYLGTTKKGEREG